MNPQDLFERGVVTLQEAALGRARWSEAALLISEISGTSGNALAFADGRTQADAHFLFMRLCHDGEHREDLEREYFSEYWARDESIPRVGRLPDGALVPTAELYTKRERERSPAYTEARRKADAERPQRAAGRAGRIEHRIESRGLPGTGRLDVGSVRRGPAPCCRTCASSCACAGRSPMRGRWDARSSRCP